MSEKPISPLRQRMIEDMSVRNFVEKTRNDYIRHVKTFTAFLGRSPETATPEGSSPLSATSDADRRAWPELNSTSRAFVICHETKPSGYPTSRRNHLTATPSCPAAVITPIKSP